MRNIAAIVLAGGKGKRMKSATPKVLHKVAGKKMLDYPLGILRGLGIKRVVCVVGHKSEEIREAFSGSGVDFCIQEPQNGTGHAVKCALTRLKDFNGDILILSGDTPLVTAATVKGLITLHRRKTKAQAVVSLVSAILEDAQGYGRVKRDSRKNVTSIVEEKDATSDERVINEVNCGIYLIDAKFLKTNIKKLSSANAQGEYYLPDLVAMARESNRGVKALVHADPQEVMGVNNRAELAIAERVMRERINRGLMLSGVTLQDPATTYIDFGVKVGRDTVIQPNVHLCGSTKISTSCVIEEGVKITDSTVGSSTRILSHSIIEDSTIGKGVTLGPFARLRPGSVLLEGARIGNFVEIKKSRIGKGSKAGHLSYIGDTTIGAGVNIGAGVITCNYDGTAKFKSVIKDNVFVGSDSQLVAPVTIGKDAYIGSGSTITTNIPPGSLALTRADQRVFKDWVKKRKKK